MGLEQIMPSCFWKKYGKCYGNDGKLMKIFALKEESSDNSETVVYGWLTYFEEEKRVSD
ncbi:MAG: hypothetical protein ACLUO5_05410 [Ruminococcus sp.]